MEITCPEKEVDFQASQEEIIRNVHNYLIEHISERITIEMLSKRVSYEHHDAENGVQKSVRHDDCAHMKQHRMELAAGLLLKTQNDIASVAQAVGYESQSRFTAAFKEAYGELPTEYRRRHACRAKKQTCDACAKCPIWRAGKFCEKLPLKKYFQKSKIIENVWRMCVNPVCYMRRIYLMGNGEIMKRIQSACICQTLHFQLKEGVVAITPCAQYRRKLRNYKNGLERSHTKYKIVEEHKETDGSIVIKIIKQYNSAPVGDYLN